MAHVIGIPIIKGPSHRALACEIHKDDINDMHEGMAVKQIGGTTQKLVAKMSNVAQGKFCGFVFDICKLSRRASLLRSCELVALPCSDRSVLNTGDAVKINVDTGLIDSEGTLIISNSCIEVSDLSFTGISGKTGEPVGNELGCVGISLCSISASSIEKNEESK